MWTSFLVNFITMIKFKNEKHIKAKFENLKNLRSEKKLNAV